MYTFKEKKTKLEDDELLIGISKGKKELQTGIIEIRKRKNKESKKKKKIFKIKTKDDEVVETLLGNEIDKLKNKPDYYYRAYDETGFIGYYGVYKNYLIPILLFFGVLLLIAIIFLNMPTPKDNNDIQPGELTHLTLEEKQELAQKMIDDSMYEIRAQTLPMYKDGKLNICVENKDINKISVRIAVLNRDGKQIYYSNKLEPGNYIEWATLDEPLEAGEAQLRFDYLDNNDDVYHYSYVKIKVHTEN